MLVKYSIKGKCIERSNDAPLSKPVDALFAPSDIQTHSPGADAQGGNGSGRRDGKKPYPKSKPGQGKRRRISDSDKESLEEEERPGDEDEIPGTVSEDDNNHRCPYPGTNCKKKRFQTSDDVM